MTMMADQSRPQGITQDAELRAAIALWDSIAAFAWEQSLALGRGVVLAQGEQLIAAQQQQSTDEAVTLPLGYVPMLDVPSGDDFLQIIANYDMTRQIVLLIGTVDRAGGEDDEQLLVLEASEDGGRATPEECFYTRQRDASNRQT
jgi:hypothetical protein